jgi:methylated-DNA-[protein]-cysteine S-methyltransferase
VSRAPPASGGARVIRSLAGTRAEPSVERHVITTPIGGVEIVLDQGRVQAIALTSARPTRPTRDPIVRELQGFFQGDRGDLREIPVDLSWATPFERDVYAATRCIPFGKVATYGQIARAIGHPRAQRAVGNALGKCPIGIVIPCHRVIAADGLGGYRELVEWKKKLLRFEGVLR